jgi:cobalt-zinc-cadmium resistance protein CzcA
LLKAQTDVEQSRLAVNEIELRREVSKAFYDLLYAHDVLNIYSRQNSIYNDFNRVAVAKFKAGETGRLEKMNAERLKRENEIKNMNAERDFRTAQLVMMKWVNTDTLIVPVDSIDDKAIFQSNPSIDSPLLMLAEADVDVANRQLKLEKRGYLPTLSLGASIQAVIKGFNPYNIERRPYSKGDFMGFSVGVNIPLAFGAQKAKMNAARKNVDIARLNVRNQEYMLRKAYEVAYNDYLSARNSLEYYQTKGVPQAREMERISKISYENGSIGYIELMQNMQSAVDVWKEYADAVCRYNKTIVELNYLKGDNK